MTAAHSVPLDSQVDLPEGWSTVPFKELFVHVLGGQWGVGINEDTSPDSVRVKVIRGTEFRNWDKDKGATAAIRLIPSDSLQKRRLRLGDLVIEISGGGPEQPVGRTLLIDDVALKKTDLPLICSNFCRQIRINQEIDSRFVQWVLRFQHAAGELNIFQTQTTNIRNLSFENFARGTEILLPPVGEQNRIVETIEQLVGRVNAARERLAHIPATLKRFRQAVLVSAFTGKLTASWRKLDRVGATAKNELGIILSSANHQKKHGKPDSVDDDTLSQLLPNAWAIASLSDLFKFIDYRGKNPKKSERGKRLISAKNIKMGYLAEEPVEFVSDQTYKAWMTRGLPRKGDILFVTEGHTMGFAAINSRQDEFALAQRTITLQPWHPINTHCFLYFIMSPTFQNVIRLNATGSAAVGIKGATLQGLPVPFPSLAEQNQIVCRVEALFTFADAIEKRLVAGNQRVEKLTQAILAKAFRGELVPTEAELARREGRSYESGAELLARIEAARQQPELTNQQQRRSRGRRARSTHN